MSPAASSPMISSPESVGCDIESAPSPDSSDTSHDDKMIDDDTSGNMDRTSNHHRSLLLSPQMPNSIPASADASATLGSLNSALLLGQAFSFNAAQDSTFGAASSSFLSNNLSPSSSSSSPQLTNDGGAFSPSSSVCSPLTYPEANPGTAPMSHYALPPTAFGGPTSGTSTLTSGSGTPPKSLIFDDVRFQMLVEHMRPGQMYKFLNILEKRCHVLRYRLGMPGLQTSTLDHEQQLLNLIQAHQTSSTPTLETGLHNLGLSSSPDHWASMSAALLQNQSNEMMAAFLSSHEESNAFMGRGMTTGKDDENEGSSDPSIDHGQDDNDPHTLSGPTSSSKSSSSSSSASAASMSMALGGFSRHANEALDGNMWQQAASSIAVFASE